MKISGSWIVLFLCIFSLSVNCFSTTLNIEPGIITKRSDSLINLGQLKENILELKLLLSSCYKSPEIWKRSAIPVFNELVRSYGESRDFKMCNTTLKKQWKWMKKYGGSYLDFGKLYHNYARLLFYNHLLPQAIFFNKIAICLKTLHKPIRYQSIISTYRELGDCYQENFDAKKAKACFNKCLLLNESIKDSNADLEYAIVEKYTKVLFDEGDYEAVKSMLLNSLSLKYSSKFTEVFNRISIYQHLSEFAFKPLGDYDNAAIYLQKAKTLIKRYEMKGYFDQTVFELSEAGIYFEIKNYNKAKAIYLSCLDSLNSTANYNKQLKANLYFNLFSCCIKLREFKNGNTYLDEYAKLEYPNILNSEKPPSEIRINKLLIDVQLNNHTQNINELKAIWKSEKLDLDFHLTIKDLLYKPQIEHILKTTGEILSIITRANPTKELKQLNLIYHWNFQEYDRLRNSLSGTEFINVRNKISNDENIQDGVHLAFQLYSETKDQKYLEYGLQFIERDKATQLTRVIKQVFNNEIPGLPKDLNEDILKISNKLKTIYSLEIEDPSSIDHKQKYKVLRSYNNLLSHVAEKYPNYFKTVFDPGLFNVDKFVRVYIKPDESFINLLYTDSVIYYILLQKDISIFRRIDLSNIQGKKLKESIIHFKNIASNKPTSYNLSELIDYQNTGIEIYKQLIAPDESRLLPNIIISSNGILSNLAFEMIPRPQKLQVKSWKQIDYLVKHYAISYTNSLGVYQELNDLRYSHNKKDFLGIAFNPVETGGKLIASIPYALKELKYIKKQINGNLLTALSASKENVLDQAANARILHIASHAIVDSSDGNKSYLVFASDSLDKSEKLFAYELYRAKLNNNLVVLSSCESGTGNIQSGEGIIGLTRAFFYTGARCVLPGLWNISDYQASLILPEFYTQLNDKSTYSQALQRSKINYINNANKELAHPFYWAAYIIVGNAGLTEGKGISTVYYLIPLLLLLIAAIFYNTNRSKAPYLRFKRIK